MKQSTHIGKNGLLEEKLKDAKVYAGEGDACMMENCLSLAETYAQKVGRDISGDSKRIQDTGYANAVDEKLRNAGEYAGRGNDCMMENCLSLAETYAQKVGRDISSDVERIKKILKSRIELST